MKKKIFSSLLIGVLALSMMACSSKNAVQNESEGKTNTESTKSTENSSENNQTTSIGKVDNTLAEDTDKLKENYVDKFQQKTYKDEKTGVSITYNIYLPEGYDESKEYPMVVFIGDSSCTGNDATKSLSQGRGALVWASSQWQSVNPTIVAVPTYPETILDDHGSYTKTEYVEMTKDYIDYMSKEYSVDTNRIYGTGQSMGCMTTLILASEYPDLYAACMFVDGQWDISELSGLKDQKFIYFAAEDDTNAWNGAQEVMSMLKDNSVSYQYKQWDGSWSVDKLSSAAMSLFTTDEDQYFVSWKTGTIEPKTNIGSAGGSFGGPNGKNNTEVESNSEQIKPSSDFKGPSGTEEKMGGQQNGDKNSSSYHMASFDYAYNCVAAMEWLFTQSKTN